MLSLSLHLQMGHARETVKDTVKLALLLETDVLLSIIAATTSLAIKLLAPSTPFVSRVLALVSWAYMYISMSASWAIAGRFVAEHGGWSLSRKSATVIVLAPSALGPPILCAMVLPYTFPHYTLRWTYFLFAISLIPAIFIALFGKATTPVASLPSESTSSISPSLLIRPALSFRASKPLPMRVALLRGAYFPRKKPMIHPLVKKRQYRHKSPLKNESITEAAPVLNYGQEWV